MLKWDPPLDGCVKLNCDAAVSASIKGVGVVIRNSSASPIIAFSALEIFNDVLRGEALVVRVGLQSALEAGLSNILVEPDSSKLVTLLNNSTLHPPVEVACIIHDIRIFDFLPKCNFLEVDF
ncbi:uncharacterized protein LOC122638839 [Telopea speciosissima]|uniref:uncharacterized protein LOC122638839 n=1 Tax=Telopea speciosissima TaxID=54955 RepID=UPI001CC6D9D2|nr:uncharacterized protein LOC122638839 [Telopea speciosissima]